MHPVFRRLGPWRLGLAADLAAGGGPDRTPVEGGFIPLPDLDGRVWRILSALLVRRWLEERAPHAALLRRRMEADLECRGGGMARIRAIQDELRRLPFRDLDPSFLGSVYERYLASELRIGRDGEPVLRSAGRRRVGGAYYTPPPVVNYILARTLAARVREADRDQVTGIAVLDPACGAGSFLRAAAAVLEGRYRELAEEDEIDVHRAIMERHLYGVDLDPEAVEVARRILLLRAAAAGSDTAAFPRNIRPGNALVERSLEGAVRPFRWEDEFPAVLARGGFDVIVGNPPWVSFGLRGAERCGQAVDAYLRSAYPNSAEYKLSVYALFVERAIRLLRDGGICGFIVPDSFLLGRYFSKLRRHLLDTVRIREIVLVLEDFWREGNAGRSVVIVFEKEPDAAARDANEIALSCCAAPGDLGRTNAAAFRHRQGDYRSLPRTRFRLCFSERNRDLLRRIERGSVPLSGIVSIHTGVRSRIGQRSIVAAEKRGETWRPGLVSGSEIGRYRLRYSGHFLNIDPALLWSGGWDPAVVSREKLLVRQTGDALHAAYDPDGYYHLNNCHAIVLKGGGYLLKYILAILNSRMMNRYYQLVSLERGRAFAQVDMDMLGELPIHPAPLPVQREIAALADRAIASLKEGDGRASPEAQAVLDEVDRAVCRLYDLTDEQIRLVEGAFMLL
ncbi:MAG: TaqI-like C-terminal specificity domain-containing protein [Methanomicrobiales archaeon]|nr:TaqI-like C-terminal specificity domain-containing protein [Methanomicrobiales archaeon]